MSGATQKYKINITLYKPLKYFLLYILITLAFSLFGPVVYENYDKVNVFVYIISFLILFSIGFHLGTVSKVRPVKVVHGNVLFSKIILLLKICIILSLLLGTLNFATALIAGKISLSWASIGQNYVDFYAEHRAGMGGNSVAEIVTFLTGFPRLVVMVLGVYYFKHLNNFYKSSVIAFLALWIVTNTLSHGNQKATGDIFIYTVIVSIIKTLDLSGTDRKKMFTGLLAFLGFFCAFISLIQYQRLAATGVTSLNIDQHMGWFRWYDWNHIIFKLLGDEIGLALSAFITGYLSGGYYGLSLCFQLPFVWTFGIGNSYSLMVFLSRFMGVEGIFDRTYLARMETITGWHGLMAWNTIFPWLASDFTFIGTLIIFIPVAYIYAVSWKEIIKYRNPISILMFSMLTMGLIFVPANNQLLHGVDGFITTTIIIFLWVIRHKKYNYVNLKLTNSVISESMNKLFLFRLKVIKTKTQRKLK